MLQKNTSSQRKKGIFPHYNRGFSDAIRQARRMDNIFHVHAGKADAFEYALIAEHKEKSAVFQDYFEGLARGFGHVLDSYREAEGMNWEDFKSSL